MKKNKTVVICASAGILLSMLSGCTGKHNNSTSTEVSTTTAASVTTEKTTAAMTATTMAETTGATTAMTTTSTIETTAPAPDNTYPERLFIEDFISPKLKDKAADIKKAREEFSETNKFFDFEFIEEVEKTDIPDEDKTKAVTLAADEQAYKDSMEPWYLLDNWVSYDMISLGKAKPEFNSAYEFDFDGEGSTERFLLVDVPQTYDEKQRTATLLIYENSSGNMNIVGFGDGIRTINIIDYGEFKQFVFSCRGLYGYREHTAVYGVISGTPKKLLDERINFDYPKLGCFLYHGGWQDFSEFMVYDTVNNEYKTITGYPADTKKLKKLDTHHDIDEFERYGIPDEDTVFAVVGEKYLYGRGGISSYTYENGRFTPGGRVPYSMNLYYDDDDLDVEWFDVDIDYAWEASGYGNDE